MSTTTSTAPSTARPSRAATVLSVIVLVLGVLVAGTGIAIYAVTGSKLQAQHADVNPDAPSHAGQQITDPFTALAQIDGIQKHVDEATGGKTFGQLPQIATSDGKTYNKDVTAATSTDGQTHAKGDPLSASDAKTYSARNTAQTASFLQASLFLSVLAFGVSAFIIGVGVIVALIGATLMVVLRRPAAVATA